VFAAAPARGRRGGRGRGAGGGGGGGRRRRRPAGTGFVFEPPVARRAASSGTGKPHAVRAGCLRRVR